MLAGSADGRVAPRRCEEERRRGEDRECDDDGHRILGEVARRVDGRWLRSEEEPADPAHQLRCRDDDERDQREVRDQLAQRLRDGVEPLARGVGEIVAVAAEMIFLRRARREGRWTRRGSDRLLCGVGRGAVRSARRAGRFDTAILLEAGVELRGAGDVATAADCREVAGLRQGRPSLAVARLELLHDTEAERAAAYSAAGEADPACVEVPCVGVRRLPTLCAIEPGRWRHRSVRAAPQVRDEPDERADEHQRHHRPLRRGRNRRGADRVRRRTRFQRMVETSVLDDVGEAGEHRGRRGAVEERLRARSLRGCCAEQAQDQRGDGVGRDEPVVVVQRLARQIDGVRARGTARELLLAARGRAQRLRSIGDRRTLQVEHSEERGLVTRHLETDGRRLAGLARDEAAAPHDAAYEDGRDRQPRQGGQEPALPRPPERAADPRLHPIAPRSQEIPHRSLPTPAARRARS